jgi:hypothetical protein
MYGGGVSWQFMYGGGESVEGEILDMQNSCFCVEYYL